MVRLLQNEKKTYQLNIRRQMWQSILTMAMTLVLNWLVSLFLAFIKPRHSLMLWLVLNWRIYVFFLHSPNQDIFGARPSRVCWSFRLLFLLCPQLGYMVTGFSDYANFDYKDLAYLTRNGNTDLPGVWVFDIAVASWTRMVYLHFMMTSSNGSIFRVTGPLCGEFTDHRCIPLTKASDAELWCFLWSAPE